MPETREKVVVIPYRVKYTCDECKEGFMITTGQGYSNNVGSYWEHHCNRCGHKQHLPKNYPHIAEEIIDA